MSDKGVNALYYYFIPHFPAVNGWANNSDYADHSVKCGLRFTLTATYLYGLYTLYQATIVVGVSLSRFIGGVCQESKVIVIARRHKSDWRGVCQLTKELN